jgi:hypothetical protein
LCLSNSTAAAILYKEYIQNPFLSSNCETEYDVERFQIHPYIQLAKIQIHQGNLTDAKINLNQVLHLAISPETIDRIKQLLEYC